MSVAEIVKHLNKAVMFQDTPYILTACIMRLCGTEIFYQVELKDTSTPVDSLIIADPRELTAP